MFFDNKLCCIIIYSNYFALIMRFISNKKAKAIFKITLAQNEDKRHFWRLFFVFSKIFSLVIYNSIQRSDLEQNKKGYSLSISPFF